MTPQLSDPPPLRLSVIIPLYDEAGPIGRLLEEVGASLVACTPFEVICVDDGSADGTFDELLRAAADKPWLRVLSHAVNCGKSAAIWTGANAARAPVVATMNGDGRNDPRAIPRMVAELGEAGPGCGLVAAQRIGRHDSAAKRLRAKISNLVRASVLGDGTRDTTCGLKCFPRDVFLQLPFFHGMHRFLPALVRADGYAISLIDVIDRPRWDGRQGGGAANGLWRGMTDIIGVNWLAHRRGHVPVRAHPVPQAVAVDHDAPTEHARS